MNRGRRWSAAALAGLGVAAGLTAWVGIGRGAALRQQAGSAGGVAFALVEGFILTFAVVTVVVYAVLAVARRRRYAGSGRQAVRSRPARQVIR